MRHTKAILTLLLTLPLLGLPALAQQNIITTAIGGGPNDMPAIDADINQPFELTLDAAGNLYIVAGSQNRAFKVSPSGTLTVVAGSGLPGYAGDGVVGGAANALLNNPAGIAVDPAGNVYISDNNNCVIRKVDTTNTITTIAGQAGQCAYNGSGAPATNFYLYYPAGLAEGSGNLYIADQSNQIVRKLVLATGTISNYAGTPQTGGFSGDGGPATSATLYNPISVAVDPSGNVFISDASNYRIREVAASTGHITTVAGNGTSGYAGDGSPATQASFELIGQVAVTVNGGIDTVTLVDIEDNVVRQFAVGGNIFTIAGDALTGYSFCGDGGPAVNACFYNPFGVAVTSTGANIYVADNGNDRIRKFQSGGNINTMAGNGSGSMPTPISSVPPQGVVLYNPYAAMEDPSGNVFVADLSNAYVRELVESTDLVNLYAGTGVPGYNGDGILATTAELNSPAGVARDSFGNVYIADTYNCVIREVSPSGIISTFAGTPQICGYSGDGGSPTAARLYYPFNVFVDSHNNVFIADTYNCVIRKASGGTITTYAGDGTCGYVGDGGPPADAEMYYPSSLTEDGAGNVYIADTYNNRIRMVSASTGNITTVAGDGNSGFTGDGVATQNSLYIPQDVKADANGNLFIADTYNQRVRWVTPSGIMTTIAGTGGGGFSGDGGPAGNAELYYPIGIFEDPSGNLLVADQQNLRIRGISAFAGLGVSASSLTFGLLTIGSTSPPQALTLSAVGPLSITTVLASGAFEEADNCPASLANAQTCEIYVYFKPTGSGIQTGSLTIEDNGYFNGTTTIALQGEGSAISITGAPVIFGNQLVKTASAAHSVTVANKGKTSVTMGAITLVETTDFAISSNTCPASGSVLAASASCAVGLTFSPQSTGAKKGVLLINNNDPTSPQLVGVTGTGTSNVTFAPAAVTFAAQTVGAASSSTRIVLTNKTAATLTLGTPAVSVSGPFLTSTGTTCTNGKVLAVNATCLIYVEFKPTAGGYATGALSVTDNDVTSPQTVALSGTGTYIKFNPSPMNFGIVAVGTQVSGVPVITNIGPTTVTVTAGGITGPNSTDFVSNAGEPPCGGSIPPGGTCTFTIYFTPSLVGTESASYLLFDSGVGSPQALSLTGQGH
jgi:hypothetical protein